MSGNVAEFCYDWYDPYYYRKSAGAADPKGSMSGKFRCVRGGSWTHISMSARAVGRDGWNPGDRDSDVGFRVVRH
jgi:formylglycine-generating enzyme required for sulfatase activity